MSVKLYLSVWALFAFAVIVAFATGNLTMFTTVVFGFVFTSLAFMGMMNVLPIHVAHPAEPKPIGPEPEATPVTVRETPAKAFHVFKSA